jgi:hypothetical protein
MYEKLMIGLLLASSLFDTTCCSDDHWIGPVGKSTLAFVA